jgi:hypothetical protein
MSMSLFCKNDVVVVRRDKHPEHAVDLQKLVGHTLKVVDTMNVPASQRMSVDHDQRVKVQIRGEAAVSEWISGGWFEQLPAHMR